MKLSLLLKILYFKVKLYRIYIKLKIANCTIVLGKNLAIKNSCFKIKGNGNQLEIQGNNIIEYIEVYINGDYNSIIIGKNVCVNRKLKIHIEDNDCKLFIGKYTTFEDTYFALTENKSQIVVGDDCMFAYDIELKTGDSHSIIDVNTGKRLNYAKDIVIGNHVWIAAHAVILKGVIIPDNSLIASNALVTKRFGISNIIIGGNPAKLIREGITWDRKRINI